MTKSDVEGQEDYTDEPAYWTAEELEAKTQAELEAIAWDLRLEVPQRPTKRSFSNSSSAKPTSTTMEKNHEPCNGSARHVQRPSGSPRLIFRCAATPTSMTE